MPVALQPQMHPTLPELARRFGNVPARRIRLDRYPADETDVEDLHNSEDRLYELVDGVLLEKEMAYRESAIAVEIIYHLKAFVRGKSLGVIAGSDGMMRLAPGLIRIPDVSFVRRAQFPGGKISNMALPSIYPDLAVEVLSPSNTAEEMDEKLNDYFTAGTTLAWLVEPDTRSVLVFASADRATATRMTINDTLDGGSMLPGFALPLAAIFAELDAIESPSLISAVSKPSATRAPPNRVPR